MESKVTRRPRYGISTEVEIHYSDRAIVVPTIDIGNMGIGILSPVDIQPMTGARINIKIPEDVSFYCMSVWSSLTSPGYKIGFTFNGMFYEGTVHDDPSMIDKVIQRIVSEYG